MQYRAVDCCIFAEFFYKIASKPLVSDGDQHAVRVTLNINILPFVVGEDQGRGWSEGGDSKRSDSICIYGVGSWHLQAITSGPEEGSILSHMLVALSLFGFYGLVI